MDNKEYEKDVNGIYTYVDLKKDVTYWWDGFEKKDVLVVLPIQ